MSSPEYQTLFQSIADLRAELMNFPSSPTVPYSNENLLKCQAFVVFSHAEMQVYWESVARRILTSAEQRWRANSTIDRVIGTLVSFRRPEKVSVPIDPFTPHDAGNFSWIVEEATKAHSAAIGNNNGIKRSNIANLLIPLGVLPGDFVEALLIQLDQTGKKRGDIVHKSSKVSLRQVRDPFADEMKDIDTLIVEIESFDNKLQTLGVLPP